jgi:hypothetical protein
MVAITVTVYVAPELPPDSKSYDALADAPTNSGFDPFTTPPLYSKTTPSAAPGMTGVMFETWMLVKGLFSSFVTVRLWTPAPEA